MIKRIETGVTSKPVGIAGRMVTTGSIEEEMVPGPSTTQPSSLVRQQLLNWAVSISMKNFVTIPSREKTKTRIEICKTLLPIVDSPMSPPPHERGSSLEIPLLQADRSGLRASFHIQNSKPYEDLGT